MNVLEASVDELEFNYDSHWVSRQCDAGLPISGAGPLLSGMVKFGLVWNLVWGAYLLTRWEYLTPSFAVTWSLALLWVNLAPFFIWMYDQVVLPEFFDRFRELNTDQERLTEIAKKYNGFFAEPRPLASVLWGVFVLVIAWAGTPILTEMGMSGGGEPFLWLTYVYAAYIGVVLGGPGFVGPLTTILMIREIAGLDFEIQPLHPDQLGGLSNVGYCAIRTTLLYSTASLFFPLGFQLAAGSGREIWILAILGFYVVTVLGSFVYPTLKINRKAAELREGILDGLRQRSDAVNAELEAAEGDEQQRIQKQLELQRIRRKYDDYNNVRLYPLQVDIFVRLAASVLLPIMMLFLEFYLLGT